MVDEAEELRQMREHAAEQAALFGIGSDDETDSVKRLTPHDKASRSLNALGDSPELKAPAIPLQSHKES